MAQNPFCEAVMTHDGKLMVCERCEMEWSVNDAFPPNCEFELTIREEQP
jgi:hypothetical protein